jgi:hypothetical protein
MTTISARSLTAIALGLSLGLLLIGWVFGLSTVDVATGLTVTGNCGSPWLPQIGAGTPFSDSTAPSPEQCLAAFGDRGVLGAAHTAAGFLGVIGTALAKLITTHSAR